MLIMRTSFTVSSFSRGDLRAKSGGADEHSEGQTARNDRAVIVVGGLLLGAADELSRGSDGGNYLALGGGGASRCCGGGESVVVEKARSGSHFFSVGVSSALE